MPRPPLIAMVTDRRRYAGDEGTACTRLIEATRQAALAGVDVVQIREPDLDDRQLADLVGGVVAAAAGTPCRVVVNARADVARIAGAHGVHLRGTWPPADRIRAVVPTNFLVGRSVHSAAEAEAVERGGGCDYLVFGTIFPSVTKGPEHPVVGLGQLAEVCARVQLPVLAIGGVTVERAIEAAASGAAGIAAIDLFAALPTSGGRMGTAESWHTVVSNIRFAFERG